MVTVPSQSLCGTTVHVDPLTEDAGLELLLTRLLRMVTPSGVVGAGRPGPGATEDTAQPETAFPAVSASEARALLELLAARGIAQGQLAALLGLEKSTVSRLAAGLERKGWLRRGRNDENHRYVRLYLTPEGRMIADGIWQAWQSRQARIIASLSAEERAGLAAGLRGLVRGLAAEGLLDQGWPNGGAAGGPPDEGPDGGAATTPDHGPVTGRYTETPSAR
jgi:DNA-binding MarR family transcriptional regulator